MISSHRLFPFRSPIFGPVNKKGGNVKELNKRLAALLGWTNFAEAGGALLGRPPGGSSNSRDQAAVPDWCGSWVECGPLMTSLGIAVGPMNTCVVAGGFVEQYVKHADRDAAARCAIVLAGISRLERSK